MAPTTHGHTHDAVAEGQAGITAASAADLVYIGEPGGCGGNLDPGQALLPDELAHHLDGHVWPSIRVGTTAVSRMATVRCHHVNWPLIAQEHPDLFSRRQLLGAPPIELLLSSISSLARLGWQLCLEVVIEAVDGKPAAVVYGAGVVGRLDDHAWHVACATLVTCTSTVTEPLRDQWFWPPRRPARPPTRWGTRPLPDNVIAGPAAWSAGDGIHSWWSWGDALDEHCQGCPAHHARPGLRGHIEFGPGGSPVVDAALTADSAPDAPANPGSASLGSAIQGSAAWTPPTTVRRRTRRRPGAR